ncbi:hypothetical protein [Granulicella sibirica]|uniref:Uncharacterized protein n=1 Tax=Granulicella sibirica TaxID=2479048 RepID=A0A4V1L635_9BACT|nr:hypothetical protein [Granulicella sibirica]RXH57884.1 hypothetical protein GRAN_1194 [Granulicella sibirica]
MILPRKRLVVVATAAGVLLCGIGIVAYKRRTAPTSVVSALGSAAAQTASGADPTAEEDRDATVLYAHNLRLRQGPAFRVYVRWIRGQMLRSRKSVIPSFDDPESFVLRIDKGVIHANIGDVSAFLNANAPKDAPMKNISIQPNGDQIKLHGTVHKILPLSVELDGTLAPTSDGRVRFHVTKIDVLKIPLKGLLGGFHLELSDLVHATNVPGVQVVDNDILFDTEKLLPPPHIRGPITSVEVNGPDLEVIYGGAKNDETKLSQWHNFLMLTGGTVDFGKLTMRNVDLTMIDASQEPWFDLDLVNYQEQLVNGYTRMTPQAGLQIFMPGVDDKTVNASQKTISMEWLKNRSAPLPAGVPTN